VPAGKTTECLGYWYLTEAKALEKVCAPLYLDDGTGVLMISPQALEVNLYASLLEPGVYSMIRPGQNMFVIGSLQENPWLRKKDDASDELPE